MLKSLVLSNFIIIKNIEIEFYNGLSVITGETGAGKSILLDAIMVALGGKVTKEVIKDGENQASVIASFEVKTYNSSLVNLLQESGIDFKNINTFDLIIRRVISKTGSSKAYVNDIPVSLNFLKQIGDNLVDIHGQNDNQNLINPNYHRSFLDSFINDSLKTQVEQAYYKYKDCETQYNSYVEKLQKLKEEQSYRDFILQELVDADVKENEENDLLNQKTLITQSEVLLKSVNKSLQLLTANNQIIPSINQIISNIEKIKEYFEDNPNYQKLLKLLDNAFSDLSVCEDLLLDLKSTVDDNNLYNIDDLEERLILIRTLAKKHKVNSLDLPQLTAKLQKQTTELQNSQEIVANLLANQQKAQSIFVKHAQDLSLERINVAKKLDDKVNSELLALNLPNAQFKTIITSLDNNYSSFGTDKVVFQIKTNVDSDFKDLNKIASGGEMARFMLALKVVLAEKQNIPCMIFDEIDIGVGGEVAHKIGERLLLLANHSQVLVITHSHQVAALGDYHYKVLKTTENATTIVNVILLSFDNRVEELARIISSNKITPHAQIIAQELLKNKQG